MSAEFIGLLLLGGVIAYFAIVAMLMFLDWSRW
jgi:hypothetical protein